MYSLEFCIPFWSSLTKSLENLPKAANCTRYKNQVSKADHALNIIRPLPTSGLPHAVPAPATPTNLLFFKCITLVPTSVPSESYTLFLSQLRS